MRKIALSVLLVGALSWGAADQDQHSVNVHVVSSHWGTWPGSPAAQTLNIIIDGKKYELEAAASANPWDMALLAPGDYKAKLVRDVHKTAYESSQVYEFLFPDKKTRRFIVVGLSE
jgi:hypothetical protein